jgi:hypothetical protein
MTNVMHKFLTHLSIYFCLICFGLSFSPSSEAGVQLRQWFQVSWARYQRPGADNIRGRLETFRGIEARPFKCIVNNSYPNRRDKQPTKITSHCTCGYYYYSLCFLSDCLLFQLCLDLCSGWLTSRQTFSRTLYCNRCRDAYIARHTALTFRIPLPLNH